MMDFGFRESWVFMSVYHHHCLTLNSYSDFLCFNISILLCFPQSCPTLQLHGLQLVRLLWPWSFPARIVEWVTTSSSRGSSQLRDQTRVSNISWIAGGFFTTEPPRKPSHIMRRNKNISHSTCENEDQILHIKRHRVTYPECSICGINCRYDFHFCDSCH